MESGDGDSENRSISVSDLRQAESMRMKDHETACQWAVRREHVAPTSKQAAQGLLVVLSLEVVEGRGEAGGVGGP